MIRVLKFLLKNLIDMLQDRFRVVLYSFSCVYGWVKCKNFILVFFCKCSKVGLIKQIDDVQILRLEMPSFFQVICVLLLPLILENDDHDEHCDSYQDNYREDYHYPCWVIDGFVNCMIFNFLHDVFTVWILYFTKKLLVIRIFPQCFII